MKRCCGALLLFALLLTSCSRESSAVTVPTAPLTASLASSPPALLPAATPTLEAAGGLPPEPTALLPASTGAADPAAIAAARAPRRDAVALAEAFGRCAAPCLRIASEPPADLTQGSLSTFSLIDFARNTRYTITAELRYVGPVVLMYVETGQDVNQRDLVAAAEQFERQLYPRLHQLFGREVQPGIDGDVRITILNARDRSGAVLGYFAADDSLPRTVAPASNEREMFVQNIAQLDPAATRYLAVLVHEFQHLIHQSQQPAAATWFNEGLSQLAEDLTGFGDDGLILAYLNRPDTGLTDWGHVPGASLAHYGASHLFLRYLRSHYIGEADLNPLMQADAGHDLAAFVAIAAQRRPHLQSFGDLVADWAVANLLDDAALSDGRYSYRADGYVAAPLPRRAVPRAVTEDFSETVEQFGVDYLQLPAGSRLEFNGTPTINLTALTPSDGAAWFARRGDERSATLTRRIDLRGVSRATLEVTLWYELENDYDYAYVTVSTDGGRSWQPLRNAYTSDADPQGTNFGGALNGLSGRPDAAVGGDVRAEWQTQQFDLSAFGGSDVLLRFWVITDEAVNAPGLLIDTIAVPEIGLLDRADSASTWQAEGFARVSGSLPQQWRLMLVAQQDGATQVQPLVVDRNGRVSADLRAEADYTLVVVAATPYTTEPADYQLIITP